jgi:general secretion pathway protein M
MRSLSAREQKLIAAGILALAIGLVWLLIVGPILGGFSQRADERKTLLATYRRDQHILAGIPIWRADAEQQRRTAAAFALLEPSQAQATEALKSRIAGLAGQEGFTVKSIQDTQPDPKASKVRVRAQLVLSLPQLYESLRRLQTEEPYVSVEYVSISADRASETGHLGQMDVLLEVAADWRLAGPRQSGADARPGERSLDPDAALATGPAA